MKKNKCTVCSRVKGKRKCTIKEETMICPRCCAEIRGKGCQGCFHYTQAEKQTVEKMKKSNYRNCITKIDPEVDDAVEHALECVGKGNMAKAEDQLVELLGKHPDLHSVQYGMGVLQAMKGNPGASIEYFDKCLEIFPYYAEAWFNRGVAYKEMHDVGNTIRSMQKVVEFGNREEHFVMMAQELLSGMEETSLRDCGLTTEQYLATMDDFDIAFEQMQNQQYEEAIPGFQSVLAQNPNHPQSHGNIGLCYGYLGRMEDALDAFDKALELDPNYAPAMQNKLAVLSLQDGERLQDNPGETVEFYKDRIAREEEGE